MSPNKSTPHSPGDQIGSTIKHKGLEQGQNTKYFPLLRLRPIPKQLFILASFLILPYTVPTSPPPSFAFLCANMVENIHKFFTALNRKKARPPARPAPRKRSKKGPVERHHLSQSLPLRSPNKMCSGATPPPPFPHLKVGVQGRLGCNVIQWLGLHCAIRFQHWGVSIACHNKPNVRRVNGIYIHGLDVVQRYQAHYICGGIFGPSMWRRRMYM